MANGELHLPQRSHQQKAPPPGRWSCAKLEFTGEGKKKRRGREGGAGGRGGTERERGRERRISCDGLYCTSSSYNHSSSKESPVAHMIALKHRALSSSRPSSS